ncbi:MAG: 1-(5-phosphoribosyl)-5-[(5-phosphoribosylamino)methylideneamino]imidazole-4-carboxamide isomerase [Chloroflexi bacterium RBG_16_57_8]|nr:MAG: 1-(5-phosphoribosyl)-5-[(5-phosphoribosylamino)methylideneamino]imidazole-4-carboxamide isomerase [Chloroflexi bacterium RBG_16_57_8]
MEVIPSIDIKGGRCVRLYQGDYEKETVFSDDPLDVALNYQSLGATRLHIVDLDGAASGEIVNREIIEQIAHAMLIPTQLGGGVRSLETIGDLLRLGIDRVVLGSAAVEDPQLVKEACRRYGESVIISIDARKGLVAIHGWQEETVLSTNEFARSLLPLGVRRFIYTDITRDGTLTEPNFTAIYELINEIRRPVIAAGGVSSLTHLKILQMLGAEGAIIGKALYSGDINLKQALAMVSQA